MSQVEQSLNGLRTIGAVAELKKLADQGYALPRPKVNTHIHLPPNFSAFQNVAQAVDLAAQQGAAVLGASNYYDYEVYGDFAVQAAAKKVYPVFGLEIICLHDDLRAKGVKINDPANPGKMYICGKGITSFANMSLEAKRLLGLIRGADSLRTSKMVDQIEALFASKGLKTGLNNDKVIDMVVRRHGSRRHTVYLQERHVAQAFQEAVFATVPAAERIEKLNGIFGAATKAKGPEDFVTIQNDLRSHVMKVGKPGYVDETFIGYADAYKLIHELGGYACYPILADANNPITPFENPVESLIENIKSRGIHAAEFIPNRNDVAVMAAYTKALRAAGIIVSAGTEHNSLDLIPIEPVCKGGVEIPDDLKAIFWEGACVAAAHQFLTLNGETGFVDGCGKPNPAYKDAESRIAAFAKLGAAVIRKYRENRG